MNLRLLLASTLDDDSIPTKVELNAERLIGERFRAEGRIFHGIRAGQKMNDLDQACFACSVPGLFIARPRLFLRDQGVEPGANSSFLKEERLLKMR